MNLLEAIKERRSVRDYTEKPVDENLIKELINLAVWAPTGSNSQPWHFAVVENAGFLKRWSDLAKSYQLARVSRGGIWEKYKAKMARPEYHVFYNAPVLVAVYGDTVCPNYREDCSMAALTLMMAAQTKGLGSCWIGFAVGAGNLPEIKEALGMHEGLKLVAPVILGYPRVIPKGPARRKPLISRWVR